MQNYISGGVKMEIKAWTYEEYPGYSEEVPGAVRLKTTGDEVGVRYLHDVEYARVDDVPLHLQILLPFTRNEPDKIYPCMVFIQGSAWMEQDVWMQCAMLSWTGQEGVCDSGGPIPAFRPCTFPGTDSGCKKRNSLYEGSRFRVPCRPGWNCGRR